MATRTLPLSSSKPVMVPGERTVQSSDLGTSKAEYHLGLVTVCQPLTTGSDGSFESFSAPPPPGSVPPDFSGSGDFFPTSGDVDLSAFVFFPSSSPPPNTAKPVTAAATTATAATTEMTTVFFRPPPPPPLGDCGLPGTPAGPHCPDGPGPPGCWPYGNGG